MFLSTIYSYVSMVFYYLASVRNAPECCNGVPNILHERKENVIYGCCGTVYTSTDRCCNGKEIPLESACCGGKGTALII